MYPASLQFCVYADDLINDTVACNHKPSKLKHPLAVLKHLL